MWRVPSERITLDLSGPSVTVERLHSWAIQYQMVSLAAAYNGGGTPGAEYNALQPLFERFVFEAQPSWEISDHRGVIPPTAVGMMRLPLAVALAMVEEWLGSLVVPSQVPSAVDAVIPQGKANREIKRRLRSVKAA